MIKINGVALPKNPSKFEVSLMDLDSAESVRPIDGTLTRDRIAVKRQIAIAFGTIDNATASTILKMVRGVFFEVTYPDPLEGIELTKTFYTGNRQMPLLRSNSKNGTWWASLTMQWTER